MDLPVPTWLEHLVGPGAVGAVLGFFGIKALSRIDALEQAKVDKTDFKALLEELRDERESAKESRGRLYERVNNIGESLARLEGRISKG